MGNQLFELQNQFAGHIRQPEHTPAPAEIEDRRMAIYRDLFFNNIEGTLSSAFPVMKTLFEEEAWLAMIRDFFIKHRCKTPLFYEVAREFLDYLENERDEANDPDFLYELAHYEWVELALTVAEASFQRDDLISDSLQHQYQRSALAWLLRYQYPVHQISESFQPDAALEQSVFFVVYRNEADKVKFIELNLVSARLLELLSKGMQAQQAAQHIAEELQHPDPQQVFAAATDLIDDWRDKGILLKQ